MSLSKRVRFEVFKRDKFTCQYCGRKAPDVVLECDHIEPRAEGGGDEILNLVTSCQACNRGKGPIPLPDDSAVEKARGQLEELQERRDQLEMMVQWKRGLTEIEDMAVQEAASFWSDLSGYGLSGHGQQELRKKIDRFGLDEVMEAMKIASSSYLRFADGEATRESVETALGKIGGICYNREKWRDDPLQEAVDTGRYRFVKAYRELSHSPPNWVLYNFWTDYCEDVVRDHAEDDPVGAVGDLVQWVVAEVRAIYTNHDECRSYRRALELLGNELEDTDLLTLIQNAA